MNLYIETKDGQCVNHPAFEDNLLQAFGQIPEHWEPFVRVERPVPGVYEVLDGQDPTYGKVNGTWTDVWPLRPMTDAEKAAKQQVVKDAFSARDQASNWSAWTLDEATCTMQPPVPRPPIDMTKISQGIFTFWCGADNNWKDTTARPGSDREYKFNFSTWQWEKIV